MSAYKVIQQYCVKAILSTGFCILTEPSPTQTCQAADPLYLAVQLTLRVRGWSLEPVGIAQHDLVWKKQRLWAIQAHATFIVRKERISNSTQVVGNVSLPPPKPDLCTTSSRQLMVHSKIKGRNNLLPGGHSILLSRDLLATGHS